MLSRVFVVALLLAVVWGQSPSAGAGSASVSGSVIASASTSGSASPSTSPCPNASNTTININFAGLLQGLQVVGQPTVCDQTRIFADQVLFLDLFRRQDVNAILGLYGPNATHQYPSVGQSPNDFVASANTTDLEVIRKQYENLFSHGNFSLWSCRSDLMINTCQIWSRCTFSFERLSQNATAPSASVSPSVAPSPAPTSSDVDMEFLGGRPVVLYREFISNWTREDRLGSISVDWNAYMEAILFRGLQSSNGTLAPDCVRSPIPIPPVATEAPSASPSASLAPSPSEILSESLSPSAAVSPSAPAASPSEPAASPSEPAASPSEPAVSASAPAVSASAARKR